MRTTTARFVLWNIINFLRVEAIYVVIQPDAVTDITSTGEYTDFDKNNEPTQLAIINDAKSNNIDGQENSDLSALLPIINASHELNVFKLYTSINSECSPRKSYSVCKPAAMSKDGTNLIINITPLNDENEDDEDEENKDEAVEDEDDDDDNKGED